MPHTCAAEAPSPIRHNLLDVSVAVQCLPVVSRLLLLAPTSNRPVAATKTCNAGLLFVKYEIAYVLRKGA